METKKVKEAKEAKKAKKTREKKKMSVAERNKALIRDTKSI